MEELLNKLIEKGWLPRGIYNATIQIVSGEIYIDGFFRNWSIRELVSKESGLWQFVCTNRLLSPSNCNGARIYKANISEKFIEDRDYKYRLIVSSLQDESELEDFLIENIKV